MKRRRLGQHYLADQELARRMVSYAAVGPEERVLEIGTGKGTLTTLLAGLGASLTGYEVDPENYDETVKEVEGTGADIRLGDAFEENPAFDVLVASLPYSESSAFVEWLGGRKFARAVVMLQEDFARKLAAPPGDRDYRGVSAFAQVAFQMKVLERVGREAFSPRPRVSSALVLFTPRRLVRREEGSVIALLFSLRRREVRGALAELGLEGRKDYGRRRVYSLSPAEVHEICGR